MNIQTLRIFSLILFMAFLFTGEVFAKSAKEIDASVETALDRFKTEIPGAKEIIDKSKGILVFPSVVKAGIGLGGTYGTGALKIGGKTESYHNIIGGSVGFQLGAQVRSVYLFFMEDTALRNFKYSDGWQAGVDGSVALIKVGADASVDTTKTNEPIVAYVLGHKGLMYNLTIEGSKINKIQPK